MMNENEKVNDLHGNLVRVCVLIDDDIIKKIRGIQSLIIKETQSSYSFSRTVNEILDLGLEDRKLDDVIRILIEERNLK